MSYIKQGGDKTADIKTEEEDGRKRAERMWGQIITRLDPVKQQMVKLILGEYTNAEDYSGDILRIRSDPGYIQVINGFMEHIKIAAAGITLDIYDKKEIKESDRIAEILGDIPLKILK